MATFTKPENLNGAELKQELAAVNIEVDIIKDNLDGTISLETENETLTAEIVSKHNGTIIAPDNSANKAALLAKLGITADEAKLLLS